MFKIFFTYFFPIDIIPYITPVPNIKPLAKNVENEKSKNTGNADNLMNKNYNIYFIILKMIQ